MNYHKIGKTLEDKLAFLARYTHHLCMENSSARGYLTEKLFDAFFAGAVPIYQGDPHFDEWMEPSAVIVCDDLSTERIAEKIKTSESLMRIVQSSRTRLCKVSLDEMSSRLREFVGKFFSNVIP